MADAKRPLILFSGGLDSAFLLYDRLKNHGNADVLYADGNQGIVKIHAEKLARDAIIAALEAICPYRVINRYEVGKIGHDKSDGSWSLPGIHRPQQTAWFLAALFTIDPTIHHSAEIGIVTGDDNLHLLADLALAWKHLLRATRLGCFHNAPPALMFPIMEFTKDRCWNELPESIRNLIWTCETPRWLPNKDNVNVATPCGLCVPCRTMTWEKDSRVVKNPYDYHETFHRFMLDTGTHDEKIFSRAALRQHKRTKAASEKRLQVEVTDPTPKLKK